MFPLKPALSIVGFLIFQSNFSDALDKTSLCANPYTNYDNNPSLIEKIYQCEDFREFTQQAPIEKVDLVFAAEKISEPPSAMGHVFLKLSGYNKKLKSEVFHSISFFTQTEGVALPALAFGSLLTGRKGFYTLSPYSTQEELYLLNERRNLWEYRLNLNQEQKLRLSLYLFELRSRKLRYFFHYRNCATVILNVLQVALPELKNPSLMWVTPLDVLRLLKKNNLILERRFRPTPEWIMQKLYLSHGLSKKHITAIKSEKLNRLDDLSKSEKSRFTYYKIAQNYYQFKRETNRQTNVSEETLLNLTAKMNHGFDEFSLNLQDFKGPEASKPDSQISLGYFTEKGGLEGPISIFLPLSHTILDHNFNYMGESELKIASLSFLHDEKTQKIKILETTLFSFSSFPISTGLFSPLSKKMNLSYSYDYNFDLSFRSSLDLGFSLGKSYQISRDIDLILMTGLEYVPQRESDLRSSFDLGIVARLAFGMKLIGEASHRTNFGKHFNQGKIQLSKSMGRNFSLNGDFTYVSNNRDSAYYSKFFLKWFF